MAHEGRGTAGLTARFRHRIALSWAATGPTTGPRALDDRRPPRAWLAEEQRRQRRSVAVPVASPHYASTDCQPAPGIVRSVSQCHRAPRTPSRWHRDVTLPGHACVTARARQSPPVPLLSLPVSLLHTPSSAVYRQPAAQPTLPHLLPATTHSPTSSPPPLPFPRGTPSRPYRERTASHATEGPCRPPLRNKPALLRHRNARPAASWTTSQPSQPARSSSPPAVPRLAQTPSQTLQEPACASF